MRFIINSKAFKVTMTALVLSIGSISFAYYEEDNNEDLTPINIGNVKNTKSTSSDYHDEQFTNEHAQHTETTHEKPKWQKEKIVSNRKQKTNFRHNDPFYGKELCGNGEYSCIAVKKSDSWVSLFPDPYQRELVQRLNRTNRGLWNRTWILVPNDMSKDYMSYSPLPTHRDTNNRKTIIISYKHQAFGAYDENGNLVHWGPVSPGKPGTRTALGDHFHVYRKGGPNCWSKKFEATIPYCMFFNGGYAMHGFTMPGYPASHGCVRMYNDDAKWLNKKFADYQTRVIVR